MLVRIHDDDGLVHYGLDRAEDNSLIPRCQRLDAVEEMMNDPDPYAPLRERDYVTPANIVVALVTCVRCLAAIEAWR